MQTLSAGRPSSTSSLVSAKPLMPPSLTAWRTRTASNQPQRRGRPVTVPLHAAAEHRAVEHVEGREQGGRAVPLVVVGHRPALAGLDRQAGLGAVEGLDLRFLVERQHHGVPLVALATLDIPTYPADALPPELAAIPAVKPGSRGLPGR